jgi:hypothetical protein
MSDWYKLQLLKMSDKCVFFIIHGAQYLRDLFSVNNVIVQKLSETFWIFTCSKSSVFTVFTFQKFTILLEKISHNFQEFSTVKAGKSEHFELLI